MILRKRLEFGENVVILTDKCNQDCIFCCAKETYYHKTDSAEVIQKEILKARQRISFEGGEPTLCKDLVKWVKKAKDRGIREIILCTNGTLLSNKGYVQDLKESGVTLFNINFSSHNERLYKALTRSNLYKNTIKGIKNLASLNLKQGLRLTFVINSVNYKTMLGYARFIAVNFPEIFYIEFNLVKVLGYVQKRRYLIPRFEDIEPWLYRTMDFCRNNGMKIIVDGIPLCFMKNFESFSIDTFKLYGKRYKSFREKTKVQKCKKCSLRGLCGGVRRDYLDIFGEDELKPSRQDPQEIIAKIRIRPKRVQILYE